MEKLGVGLLLLVVTGSACNGGGSGSNSSVVVASGDAGGSAEGATTGDGGRDGAAPTPGMVAGADASTAPTWTAIYQNLLINTSYASNCTGSSCHDPGTQKGLDLSSPMQGYTTISRRLVPGKPDMSDLITVLQSGYMPQGRPKMSAADIGLITSWIQAGAPND